MKPYFLRIFKKVLGTRFFEIFKLHVCTLSYVFQNISNVTFSKPGQKRGPISSFRKFPVVFSKTGCQMVVEVHVPTGCWLWPRLELKNQCRKTEFRHIFKNMMEIHRHLRFSPVFLLYVSLTLVSSSL